MQGKQAILIANYERKDWDAMQVSIQNVCAQWNNGDQEDTGRISNSDYAAGTMSVITRDGVKRIFTGQKAENKHRSGSRGCS